jgi:hypothetical protein
LYALRQEIAATLTDDDMSDRTAPGATPTLTGEILVAHAGRRRRAQQEHE